MLEKLGKTDLYTSKIVYGCMGGAGAFGSQEEKDSIEALQTAHEVGINFFDTAEAYGNGYSEQLLNKALGHVRKDIVILSKAATPNVGKDKIITACERSLKNLGTDYIDIYLLHWPNREVPFEESLEALELLKKQGKINHFGVSNYGELDLKDAVSKSSSIAVNEVAYNLFFRAVEYGTLPTSIENDIPVLCYSSLMQGLLAGKYKDIKDFPDNRARTRMFDSRTRLQCRHGENGCEAELAEALKNLWSIVDNSKYSMEELSVGWLKKQQGVGGVLVGTRNKSQSLALKKLIDVDLDLDVINELTKITNKLKSALGPNIDMWDFRTR
ncbi:MAG: aldo/keto reductase [Sphaerochaetaceae bacterium]|nr:aldo/keto reductase [Sphaerochaetaceae bacterium]